MNQEQVIQIQRMLAERGLNVPVTGVLDTATIQAMNRAVASTLETTYPDIIGQNSADTIANAYNTGDWTKVINTYTGKPFSDSVVQGAISESEAALSPYYEAQNRFNTQNTQSSLQSQQNALSDFVSDEAKSFEENKRTLDQNAVNQGILFSGARRQKEQQLQDLYKENQERRLRDIGLSTGDIARKYQYEYGNQNMGNIGSYLNAPDQNVYNAGSAQTPVQRTPSLRQLYNPQTSNYQGATINTQKANVQLRANDILRNRANKLTSTGYLNKL